MQNGLQLFELLDAVKGRLQGDEYLNSLSIITENQGDIMTTVNTAIAKVGLSVVIGDVEARNTRLNASKPCWFPITFAVLVTENPVINRAASGSQKPGQVVASKIADRIHHFSSEWGTIVAVGIRPISAKNQNIYEVECQIGQ